MSATVARYRMYTFGTWDLKELQSRGTEKVVAAEDTATSKTY